ncbi:hypothetical protein IV417_14845 [Alphaproteobacteria bacterium KMM 3653]|uniref:Uncharacterized protein n=1 Tax=Harenicola maris TaxID=2841044 RepID=A0AAP2CRL1_9RHOB|nr:hypothetical protein [Harenicola maris]
MNKFTKSAVTGVYEKILRQKFGRLYDWEKPRIIDTVGPFRPSVFDDFEEALSRTLHEGFEVLKKATVDDLEVLTSERVPDERGIRDAWHAAFSKKTRGLVVNKPHWAAGGFGHPDYIADFDYWARMPSLSLSEAVSLSVGVEPKHLKKWLEDDEEVLELIAEPLVFAKRRSEQFKRQFGIVSERKKIPCKLLVAWIKSVDLEVHSVALEKLERFHSSPAEQSSPSKRPDKRELDSVAMLFTAMAIEQFGYVPTAKRGTTVKDIQDLAASLGITMSDDTIRHYLRLGASFIDKDWTPHSR